MNTANWADDAGLRRNNFDFLRFALAGAVVLSHSYALLGLAEPLSTITRHQLDLGKLAVDWFFVISGFLITHSWLRSRGTWDYFRKRIVRIYPAFAAALILGAFLVPRLAPTSTALAKSGHDYVLIAVKILNLRGYDPDGVFPTNRWPLINGSLWSIRYEFGCYIGVACVGLAGCMRHRRYLLIALAGAIIISVLFPVFQWNPGGKLFEKIVGSPPLWARMVPYYLAGMVFYLFRKSIPCNRWLVIATSLALIIGCIVPHGLTVALPIAGTYLLMCLAFTPLPLLPHWSKWGDFSYGMYLYAWPLQQLLIAHWGPGTSPLKLFGWSLLGSVIAGVLSWYAVEKWFLRLKRPEPKTPTPNQTLEPATAA